MSLSHSPLIVRDGLVLCLDAANPRSYPKSGTTWSDLAGANDGTLINGPTFDADDKGSIVFDGSNQYISNNYANSAEHTISIIFKIISFSSSDMRLLGAYGGASNQLGAGWVNSTFRIWISNSWNNTSFVSSVDTVYHLTITHDSSNNNTIYVDGIYEDTIINKESYFNNIAFGSPYLLVYGSYFNGNMYNISLYNRALTASEVLQNYNATRGRYGI